jgi:hypothetical protein
MAAPVKALQFLSRRITPETAMAVWPSSLKSRPSESEKFSFYCSQAGSDSAELKAFARFLSTRRQRWRPYASYPSRCTPEATASTRRAKEFARSLTSDECACCIWKHTCDVSIQAQIIGLLEALKNELGLTYLFISHDLSLIRYFCDRTGVIYLGRIASIGRRR